MSGSPSWCPWTARTPAGSAGGSAGSGCHSSSSSAPGGRGRSALRIVCWQRDAGKVSANNLQIRMFLYTYVCIRKCVHVHMCKVHCMYVCTYVHVCICVHVHVFVHCMYVCAYAYNLYIHSVSSMYCYVDLRMYTHTYVNVIYLMLSSPTSSQNATNTSSSTALIFPSSLFIFPSLFSIAEVRLSIVVYNIGNTRYLCMKSCTYECLYIRTYVCA